MNSPRPLRLAWVGPLGMDPPCWGCEQDYGEGIFSPDDFQRLATLLAGLKGQLLLPINNRPKVREIFARLTTEAVATTCGINCAGPPPGRQAFTSASGTP